MGIQLTQSSGAQGATQQMGNFTANLVLPPFGTVCMLDGRSEGENLVHAPNHSVKDIPADKLAPVPVRPKFSQNEFMEYLRNSQFTCHDDRGTLSVHSRESKNGFIIFTLSPDGEILHTVHAFKFQIDGATRQCTSANWRNDPVTLKLKVPIFGTEVKTTLGKVLEELDLPFDRDLDAAAKCLAQRGR